MGQLGAVDLISRIVEFLKDMGRKFGIMNYFFLFAGIMLVAILVSILLVRASYEIKSLRTVDSLNAYFKKKPHIGEDNLIEFNNKMKKAPQAIRISWQQYMLNRDDTPGKYINIDSCVEKPLRTSAIDKNLKNMGTIATLLMAVSFILVLFGYVGTDSIPVVIGIASIIPVTILILYVLFAIIFRSWKNAVQADLYQNFHNFQRNLTRAVDTLPTFVDYEILFTKQDIKKNIPMLHEYVEKRAIIEQQELEKARLESEETEKYDFSSLGINGSLVLDRAMKESEVYLKTKRRLEAECDQIETEKENYRKNFETATKEYQRRLQASRENLDRLKSQQESSTNRIESNYIRKQQADEMKKQEQLEKDNDESSAKFNEEQDILASEIKKRKDEIQEKKKAIEDAIKSEFHTYASSIYKEIEKLVDKDIKNQVVALKAKNQELGEKLNVLRTGEEMAGTSSEKEVLKPEVKIEPLKPLEEKKEENDEIDLSFITSDFNAVSDSKSKDKKSKKSKEKEIVEIKPYEEEIKPVLVEEKIKPVLVEEEFPDFVEEPKDVVPSFEEELETKEPEKTTIPSFEDEELEEVKIQEVKPQVEEEDELLKLQKEIDEESKKLIQHKKDFEKEIDSKIDIIEKNEKVVKSEKPVSKAVKPSKVKSVPKAVESKAKTVGVVKTEKPATKTKKVVAKTEEPIVKARKTRVPSRLSKPLPKKVAVATKKPATKAPVKKIAGGKKGKSYDNLEEITSEMENLLKKIKKN